MSSFFFFNDTTTPEIYTLSLHDALPISPSGGPRLERPFHFCTAPGQLTTTVSGSGLALRSEDFSNRTRRSEEHTSELQSHSDLVCRLLLEKQKSRRPSKRVLPPLNDKFL